MTRPVRTTYRRIEHHDRVAFLTSATVADTTLDGRNATVLLAPHVVGVCRSDLREISGVRFGRRDFGHEIVGAVVDAPPSLSSLLGRTVLFDPHPTLARRTSGFAELVELTAAPTQLRAALVPVPAGIPDRIAVFGEPLACAVHCVTRLHRVTAELGLEAQAPVAVVGAGMAGTLISAVLVAQGQPCVLLNPHRERIEFLLDHDALPSEVLIPHRNDISFSRVILATAAATSDHLATCLRMLADDGVLLLFAGTQRGTRLHGVDIDPVRRHQLTYRIRSGSTRAVVAGTYGATRDDFLEALSLLTKPPGDQWSLALCAQRLTTRVVGLDEAADYLTTSAPNGVLGKTLVQIHPPMHRESK
ncbi:MDR/zinc-dependent alcohol dehydrogenase-like family protein [Nocardia transvalensis]|uniref:MDR/zinc-dependent alcohol dehydrogenase-like family protein n=1 Tax=Nocardia transvalensis TaxID=37333 RepID=UPI0018954A90|nr:medium chain dehydrogenase/reductase family protein [Nocardia transvalensis]MBF6333197.1 alcohol dehydrogenase [Nocardia transvalensis]